MGVTEYADLPRLLDDAIPALGEGYLPVGGVLDPLDLYLASPHLDPAPSLRAVQQEDKGDGKAMRGSKGRR